MKKWVRLQSNIVMETIPDYATPPEKWYGPDFAAQCVEALDEVEQGWVYDPETGTFSPPVEPEPVPPGIDPLTEAQLAVAELAQVVEDNNTANQLAIAELAGIVLGG